MSFSLRPQRTVGRRTFLIGIGSAGVMAGSAFAVRRAGASHAEPVKVGIELQPEATAAFLSTNSLPQTGAFSVHLDAYYADTATATFNGRPTPLISDGKYLIAVLGAGQPVDDPTEIEPGPYMVHLDVVSSGLGRYGLDLPVTVTAQQFAVDYIQLAPSLLSLLDPDVVQQELAVLRATYGVATDRPLWQGLFQMPVVGEITTQFAEARSYNSGPVSGHHSGVDIGAAMGTPVGAAATGRVAFAGQVSERGNFVIVNHGLGVYTGYAHLSQINVATGAGVAPGDNIGLVGTTGLSTGPHLHWECAVNGIHVDALRWTRDLLP